MGFPLGKLIYGFVWLLYPVAGLSLAMLKRFSRKTEESIGEVGVFVADRYAVTCCDSVYLHAFRIRWAVGAITAVVIGLDMLWCLGQCP